MITEQQLKPCPFCGNDDMTVFNGRQIDPLAPCWTSMVECLKCFAKGPEVGSKDLAIKGWNTRAECQ